MIIILVTNCKYGMLRVGTSWEGSVILYIYIKTQKSTLWISLIKEIIWKGTYWNWEMPKQSI